MKFACLLLGVVVSVGLFASEARAQGCCGVVGDAMGISGRVGPAPSAASADPSHKLKVEDVRRILDDLIATSFPELSRIHYVLYTFKGKTIRFRSNVKIRSLFFGKRVYRIGVNRSVLADPPPPLALRAVLAHELAHTLYYHQRTRGQVVKTARIFFNKQAQIDFELATDLEASRRGYAAGLAAYRAWIDLRLSKKHSRAYANKYYEAVDFALIGRVAQAQPDLLLAWQSDPPRTLRALRSRWIRERSAAGARD